MDVASPILCRSQEFISAPPPRGSAPATLLYIQRTMKPLLVFALSLAAASAAAFGADVEARLLRFSGDVPSLANLVSFSDSTSIANSTVFSATLDDKNAFEYRAITPDEYPSSFDANGKPEATETRNTGIIFSGDATVSDGLYSLNITFSLVEHTNTILAHTKTGMIAPQPVFRFKKLETEITTKSGEWVLLRLQDNDNKDGDSNVPEHIVLLVRIR